MEKSYSQQIDEYFLILGDNSTRKQLILSPPPCQLGTKFHRYAEEYIFSKIDHKLKPAPPKKELFSFNFRTVFFLIYGPFAKRESSLFFLRKLRHHMRKL